MPTAFRVAALVSAAWLLGCATTTLDAMRPVEVSKGSLGGSVRQGGKPISDLAERLKDHPASAARMEGYYAKEWGATALGLLGVGLIAWDRMGSLASSKDQAVDPGHRASSNAAMTLVGSAAFLASIPLAILANRQLTEAAESFNASLAPSAAPASRTGAPTPFLGSVEGADGRKQCLAGVALRF
jgi:hypothetical protein